MTITKTELDDAWQKVTDVASLLCDISGVAEERVDDLSDEQVPDVARIDIAEEVMNEADAVSNLADELQGAIMSLESSIRSANELGLEL